MSYKQTYLRIKAGFRGGGGASLHEAAKKGDIKLVETLLSNKDANVNEKDYRDCTALHWSALEGHADISKLLIEYGANVNEKDNFGYTALHWSAQEGHAEISKLLLKNGANVNEKDFFSRTPLHSSAIKGYADVSKVLLENGANVNEKDKYGQTLLHLSVKNGHADVSKVLLENEANVNAVDSWKETPLHRAAWYGHIDVMKLLMMNGANVNALGKDDQSPMWIAAIASYSNLIKVPMMLELICGGARIDEKSISEDESGILRKVEDRLNLLRERKPITTDLFSVEERQFVEYIALCFAKQYHGIIGKKLFYDLLHLISFHGIFMTSHQQRGSGSIWKMTYPSGR